MSEKTWSVAASHRLILRAWISNAGAIELTAFINTAEDTFSEYSVAQETYHLVEECVAQK